MAFYLTQRTWARFISICREIWEPLLPGSVEVTFPVEPPQPSAAGMALKRCVKTDILFSRWLWCLKKAFLPQLLIASHDLFPCCCSFACVCKGQSTCTFTSRLSQSHQPCAFWRALVLLSCWREGYLSFSASDMALDYATSRREVFHASILLLQEELPCCGQLPRTMLVWQLCVTLQTTLQWLKRWQHRGTKTPPWKPGVILLWRLVTFACSKGLSQAGLVSIHSLL